MQQYVKQRVLLFRFTTFPEGSIRWVITFIVERYWFICPTKTMLSISISLRQNYRNCIPTHCEAMGEAAHLKSLRHATGFARSKIIRQANRPAYQHFERFTAL